MLKIVTPAATPIVTDAQVQGWLNLTAEEMTLHAEVLNIIRATAVEAAQQATGIQLMQTQYDLYLPVLTTKRVLPLPPLLSVDEVSYTDSEGASQTVAFSQELESDMGFGACLIDQVNVPDTLSYATNLQHPAKIRFTAGHLTATEINPMIIAGILKHIATLFDHRENLIAGSSLHELPDSSTEIYNQLEIHSIYQAIKVEG